MFDNLVDSFDNSLDTKLLAISRQIIILNNDIPNLENNAKSLKKDRNFLDNGLQKQQQYSNEEVNNNKDVKVLMVKGRKIATTIASAKPVVKNLLTTLTKVALIEDSQDINVRKI